MSFKKKFVSMKIARNEYRKVFLADILYCKADRSYSIIKTIDSEYTFCEPLKHLETLFNHIDTFIRVHKSYIVNMEK